MEYLFVIGEKAWQIIIIIISFLFGAAGVELLKKWLGKKTERLQLANLSADGTNLLIKVRKNIDELVEEKTAEFREQIAELNNTIVQISTKYTKELDSYIKRMGELESKVDEQRERADKIEERSEKIEEQKNLLEKNLEEEIELRRACIKQLQDLQTRVQELEKNTLQTNTPVIITTKPDSIK